MQFDTSIFIFRRDLRLIDNLALKTACELSRQVIPVFCFDPRQLSPHPYRSESGLQFLLTSLEELQYEIEKLGSSLLFLHANPENIISELITKTGASAVFCSKDYTPFSLKRDLTISDNCTKLNAKFFSLPNILLNEPEDIRSKSGSPYTIYTFFAKACSERLVPRPDSAKPGKLHKDVLSASLPVFSIKEARERYLPTLNPRLFVKGGRKEALKLLARMPNFANYNEQRNFPALSATSGLSAHNKFGTISVREFFHMVITTFNRDHTLCRELYWRDFFTHIGFNFPHVFTGCFKKSLDHIEWEENDNYIEAWQSGQTGFPIVDAGMRELNETGFMHNRVRMIVASFLTKDLLVDWHYGERYFARKLVDYDAAVNNGNWQWAASTGCDAQPYFRIFNPWLQGEKFDKEAVYIRRWVPELDCLKPRQIHQLYKKDQSRISGYPAPIVDHAEQRIRAQRMFEVVK